MPTSTGLISRKDIKSDHDADVVKNLREAGAILTCLTNTSEVSNFYLLNIVMNEF